MGKKTFTNLFDKIKTWLQSLSFRTGVIVLLCCIPFYILSFAQMLLPISAAAKGLLWTILFGLAKTCQYGGLTILGVEGYNRLKKYWKSKKNNLFLDYYCLFSATQKRKIPHKSLTYEGLGFLRCTQTRGRTGMGCPTGV